MMNTETKNDTKLILHFLHTESQILNTHTEYTHIHSHINIHICVCVCVCVCDQVPRPPHPVRVATGRRGVMERYGGWCAAEGCWRGSRAALYHQNTICLNRFYYSNTNGKVSLSIEYNILLIIFILTSMMSYFTILLH